MRLIDANTLKRKIEEVQYTQEFCIEHQIDHSVSMHMLGMVIDNAPTVEITEEQVIDKLHDTGWLPLHDKEMTERPRGEWIRHIRSIECSVCKYKFFSDDENENCQDYEPCADFNFNFCPNCGADMRKEANNDDLR